MNVRPQPTTATDAAIARLEGLFRERMSLIDEYALLWARHGGGSSTWEDTLVDVDLAPLKERLRADLSEGGRSPKEVELKEALHAHPDYRARVAEAVEGRAEWARIRERMTTVTWRIQLEMAKLRLNLGSDAVPTDGDREVGD